MPQPAAAPRAEELSSQDLGYRAIREVIVRFCRPLRPDRPDHTAAGALGVHPRRDARIRTCVDEGAARDEDPVSFL
jgi:hypothetical protein